MLGFSPLASAPLGDAGDVSDRIRFQRLVTGPPTVGVADLLEIFTVLPTDAGAPEMGLPAITQEHDLNAISISDAPFTLGVANCSAHIFFPDNFSTGEPTLGIPKAEDLYGIGPLLTGNPETGLPAITQEHDLKAIAISDAPLIVGNPPCGSPVYFVQDTASGEPTTGAAQIAELAVPLFSGAPEMGLPAITQEHDLNAISISDAPLSLGVPGCGSPVFFARGIACEQPTVGAPEIEELYGSSPLVIGAVQMGVPSLTQEHDLNAIPISDAPFTLGVANCIAHFFAGESLVTSPITLGIPFLAQSPEIVPIRTEPPTLGVVDLTQIHTFGIDPLITGASVVGVVESISVPESLVAGALELGSAQLAELAVSIVAGAPVTGASTLSIRFNFTAESIALGAPLLDDTALTQTHNLTAEPLATGAPDLQPALLAADVIGIVTLPPELGVIVLTQEHQLAAGDISSAPATPSGANITQIHGFTAESLVTDVPTVQITAITQTHNLTAEPLATGAPELGVVLPFMDPVSVFAGLPDLGSPAITQDHQIVADSIAGTPPVMGSAALTQVHLLSAESLTASAPVTSFTTITQVHSLAAESLSFSAPEVGRPKMSYEVVSIVTGALQMGKPAITQDHQLVADNINAAPSTVAIAFFTQVHKLAAESLTGSRAIVPATTITQTHRLSAETLVTGAPIVPDIALSSLRFETPRNSANGGMLVGVQATAI